MITGSKRLDDGMFRAAVRTFLIAFVTVAATAYVAFAGDVPMKKATPLARPLNDIIGEVKSVAEVKGKLLLVLVEWPVIIRITDQTRFDSEEQLAISKLSAKDLLPKRGVRIKRSYETDGTVTAEKITVLSHDKLLKIREEQPGRTGYYIIPEKDARPESRKARRR